MSAENTFFHIISVVMMLIGSVYLASASFSYNEKRRLLYFVRGVSLYLIAIFIKLTIMHSALTSLLTR